MTLPTPHEYRNAVQNPQLAFRTQPPLDTGTVLRNAMGLPKLASGGFATTFTVDAASRRWAVRCFHKKSGLDNGLQQRYEHIGRYLSEHRRELGFLTPVVYEPEGVYVHGTAYPTVRMHWLAGEPLGLWLEDWSADGGDPFEIETVRQGIADAVADLRALNIAHGDLQHGNILVDKDLRVRLIDYDGMYLPALRSLGAIEMGHRNYQHPGRGTSFDHTIDHFAAAVIDVSLLALRERPQLWDKYGGTGENLLFEAGDFIEPDKSAVFGELASMVETADLGHRLRRACQVDYAHVGDVLLGQTLAGPVSSTRYVARTSRIFDAAETDVLRVQEGEMITVVGTVEFATVTTRYYTREQVALINLGSWQHGDFTIYAEDPVCHELYERFGRASGQKKYLAGLVGWKVAITGPLELFEYKRKGRPPQLVPQIRLERTSLLHNLTDRRFAELMAQARRLHETPEPPHRSEPVVRTRPHRTPTSGRPDSSVPHRPSLGTAEKDAIRNRLFSSAAIQPTEQTKPSAEQAEPSAVSGAVGGPSGPPRTGGSGPPTTQEFRRTRPTIPPVPPASARPNPPPVSRYVPPRAADPPPQGNSPPFIVSPRYPLGEFLFHPPPSPSRPRWPYAVLGLVFVVLLTLIVLL